MVGPGVAGAATNPWPHTVTGSFASEDGRGLYVADADGTVSVLGTARNVGDASDVHLNMPVVSGTAAPGGYWLVASDGGVFAFGTVARYGSMGGTHLNQPVFAIAATPGGQGYWLAARDGGIFSFGNARFYGSAGAIRLAQPIVGMTASVDGHGYRLVAQDGGVFDFGTASYYGSLPSRGVHAADVIGIAPTPTGHGYWIAEANGNVTAFGDAIAFRGYHPSTDDPVTAIATNPAAPGYRLVTKFAATIPFGHAPAGTASTAAQIPYLSQLVCRPHLNTAADYQAIFETLGPLWDQADGGTPIDLGDGRRLWLFGDTYTGPGNFNGNLPGGRIIRNTIAVQQGNCFQYRTGALFGATSYIPDPAPGEYDWPMDGIVDAAAHVVRISAIRVRNFPGPEGFAFQEISNDLITLDLHTLTYRSSTPMPAGGGIRWGTSMMQDSHWIYLYGLGTDNRYYSARTTAEHLGDGRWQYSTGTSWSTNIAARQPLQFHTATNQPDSGTVASIDVEHYGTGYILSAKRCEAWCDDITAWYSNTPAGPWKAVNSDDGRISTTIIAPGQITYNGHLVPNGGSWMVVWNVNSVFGFHVPNGFGTRSDNPQNLPSPAALAAR